MTKKTLLLTGTTNGSPFKTMPAWGTKAARRRMTRMMVENARRSVMNMAAEWEGMTCDRGAKQVWGRNAARSEFLVMAGAGELKLWDRDVGGEKKKKKKRRRRRRSKS
jgi:hypothetical protein